MRQVQSINNLLTIKQIIVIIIVAFFSNISYTQTEGTRPNIILVFADDLGYTDVGFNRPANFPAEYGVIPTPEIDALAANGVIAKNAHVAHPFCGPSRAALLTGVYPHRVCAQYNLPNDLTDTQGISTNEKFFSKVLQENNYNTSAIGKWHLGVDTQFTPNNRGFDYFFGMLGGGHQYFESDYETQYYNALNNNNPVTNEYRVPLLRNSTYVAASEFDNDEYLTDILTEEAVTYINNNAADTDPFFMYLAYNAPHTPLQAPAAKITTFDNANGNGTSGSTFSSVVAASPDILNANIPGTWTGTNQEYRDSLVEDRLIYATMVSIMDEGVGLVKDALVANNILDNTLIIFMSDNGGKLRQAGGVNYPLAEGKGSIDEGGHRVPMLFHWPDKLSAGQSYDHLVSSIDLYPSFIELAGASVPSGKLIDGKSVMNKIVTNQDARPNESIYIMRPQNGFHNGAIMKGDYKISKKGSNNTSAGFKLYNIITDPGETTDIRSTEPNAEAIVDDMLTEGVAWVSEFQDVTPCWFDHDNPHPHEALWNNGSLPNYDGFFGIPLIPVVNEINITGVTNAIENQTNGVFIISLPNGILAGEDIDVSYTVSGEATTDGSDYTILSGIVTILEGTNSKDIIIIANEDGLAEISETVIITLTSTTTGTIDATPAEINIFDATLPTLLTTGDIAIVGYKADNGNIGELAFIILKDINSGTSISLSNRSWKDDGTFNTGNGGSPYGIDDVFSWTSSTAHTFGTVFKLGSDGIVTTVINGIETPVGNTVQTFGTDDDWDLSPVGDSVLIYSGNSATHPSDISTDWLAGLNTNGVENANIQLAGWAIGGGNAYCELPAALVGFDIDVTGGNVANPYDQNFGVYVGNASGNPTTLRASINDYTNWNLNENNAYFLWKNNDTVAGNAGNIFILPAITTSQNGNWEDTTTWIGGVVPTAYNPVIIAHKVTINSDVECVSLLINDTTMTFISVTAGNSLTVNGDVTTSNDIYMLSNSSSFSSLIVNGSVNGQIAYQRFVAARPENDLISVPVTNLTFNAFSTSGANGELFQNPSVTTQKLFGPFDNFNGVYMNYDEVTDAGITLVSGKGYRAATNTGSNLRFKSSVTTNDVSIAITDETTNGNGNYKKWNLIGNPYPSYLDFGAFFSENYNQFDIGAYQAIYGYDADLSNGSNWTIWNSFNTSEKLTPGQGFFVKTKDGGGLVKFKPIMRTIGASDDFIAGRSTTPNYLKSELFLVNNDLHFTTKIYFAENQTRGLDPGYDAGSYGSNGTGLYTQLVEGNSDIDFSIQALPYQDFNNIIVPLGVEVDAGVQATIGLDTTSSNLSTNINIYLEDNVANTFTLLNNGNYVFTPTVTINGTGRFYIHYSSSTLSLEENSFYSLHIYTEQSAKQIVVKGTLNVKTTSIIHDIQGRIVLKKELDLDRTTNIIDVNNLQSGIYVLKLLSTAGFRSKKLIIK